MDVNAQGKIFIADTRHHCIRIIDPERDLVYKVAGNGKDRYSGDNGSALEACLCVHGLRIDDNNNNLYFVDFLHHVIRVIEFE